MKNKIIGFNQEINVIGGRQGAIYSSDKKNKINEMVLLVDEPIEVTQTDSSGKPIKVMEENFVYYNPTAVPFGQKVQFGRLWFGRDGRFIFI